ncbi:MAG: tetratricopeptide repeat protein [Thermodesulfobacteriota bacterium]|nr:tetratricopeptide repeat protein [Thermodesulfobacteriota bacterium]
MNQRMIGSVAGAILFVCISFSSSFGYNPEAWTRNMPERTKQALFDAQQEIGEKKFEDAIDILTRFVERHSANNHFLVEFNLGTCFALSGRIGEAIRHLEKAAGMEEGYPPIWMNLGKLYYDNGDFRKAGTALERSFRLETNKDPQVLYMAMAAFFQADDLDKAISLGEELLLKVKKTDEDILGLLVNAYIKTENYDRAIDTVRAMLRRAPGDDKLWKLLAQLHINAHDYRRATVSYEIHGFLAGLEQKELWVMGDLFSMIGIPVKAAEYYEMALAGKEGTAEEYEKLATAYFSAFEYDRAIEALDISLNIKATTDKMLLKAQLYYLQDRFVQACQSYADAAAALGKTKDGHEWLMAGYCALRAGEKDKARELIIKAAEYPGQRKEAQGLLQMCSFRQTHQEDSIEQVSF